MSRGALVTVLDGKVSREVDTITCVHCNAIHRVTRDDPGGFCRMCMKATCAKCGAAGGCVPFERRLLELESRDRFRRSL